MYSIILYFYVKTVQRNFRSYGPRGGTYTKWLVNVYSCFEKTVRDNAERYYG